MSEDLAIEDNKGVYVDPLQWWTKHEKVYPVLAALAKDVLVIPATSARSEIFSLGFAHDFS